ncbi:MAG: ATP-dependent DNA ligase [Acidobacteria bacterium]|nr:ATP-dependent DNA ligase [Acidobacteriota bacterium]MBV9477477.1 ATP-dependent DNA ligase [Acidobacteriota bacterium]
MLSHFTATANAIAATTKKSEKERILADYLRTLDDASLERAVVFFSGSPFPRRDQRVTGVGGAAIGDAVVEATGRTSEDVWAPWPKYADAGDTIAESFADDPSRDITLSELGEFFERIAATQGATAKRDVLVELLRKVDAQGARYIVKILTSELRIGLVEGLVEASIAKAFGRTLKAVRQANMFTGDIGATALLAKSDALDRAAMSLFHPFAFMLAQPEEDPAEIVAALGAGALADDKYDGIRAQIHADGASVHIYSRTLDDVTHRFPELEEAARALGATFILDGEIVAFSDRILPFAIIQKRLGRRVVSPKLLADAPVVFFAFDLLYLDGAVLFETPLRERLAKLRELVRGGAIRLGAQTPVRDAAHIDELFDAARGRANEGLVVKDPESIYTPGRRGKSWLKYKKALATLDCVVTYAQYGNGKRRAVLSDLTFGILRDGDIVNIGKAYSGLTDVEIAAMTEQFKATGTWDGWRFKVEPTVVLEIAFDRIQESSRHKSGYALRFPRIVRIRDDKSVDEISTIDEVRRIYEGQLRRESQSEGD